MPDPATHSRSGELGISRAMVLMLAVCLTLPAASAQTLAHPGLVGNNLNTDPWWQHAVFYQVDPPAASPYTDFKDLSTRIDSLRSLSVDALIVPAPAITPHSSPNPAFDAALEDFDTLVRQTSQRGIRVLVTLRPAATDDLSNLARFWLSRGVAGIRFIPPAGTTPDQAQTSIQLLRRLAAGVVGQRIVLAAFDPAVPATQVPAQPVIQPASQPYSTPRHPQRQTDSAPVLQIDSQISRITSLTAATLRPLLAQTLAQPNLVLDLPHSAQTPLASAPAQPDPTFVLAHAIAAILLTTHSASLIDPGGSLVLKPDTPSTPEPAQPAPAPPPPPSSNSTFTLVLPNKPAVTPHPPKPPDAQNLAAQELTDWYRQLSVLHRSNGTLRFGTTTLLNFDQQNTLAWVARPARTSTLTPPVVVLCNLSSTTVQLPVGSALKALNLRGNYLRTLLRSDKAMGPQSIDAVNLPPFSVYIGELHY